MNRKPLIAAGTLMGIGMGGFLDGILFHQILQLHSMLSANLSQNILVNVKISMFWDGLFHAFTWITTAISIKLLWNAARNPEVPWSGLTFWGSLFLGFGIFNLVEGVINHHIIGIHHVVERMGLSLFDYLFLGSGVLFILIGWISIGNGKKI
ncbi:MAG: hypothetical protein JWN56_413 [Sphingobacteriales bacterium]|nr:hypothetical protein [Sphingobacteriales bacterium]